MILIVRYEDTTLLDLMDLLMTYSGYFDGDRMVVIFPFQEELVEELENRGIQFRVELV